MTTTTTTKPGTLYGFKTIDFKINFLLQKYSQYFGKIKIFHAFPFISITGTEYNLKKKKNTITRTTELKTTLNFSGYLRQEKGYKDQSTDQ